MKIEQKKLSANKGWEVIKPSDTAPGLYDLVLAFGSTGLIADPTFYDSIRETYINANILICSTAGEICDTEVNDNSVSLTAIQFDKIKIKTAATKINNKRDSFLAGYHLAKSLEKKDLKNVLVISDGQNVNGSDLVSGLQEFLPENTIITGGLAADGSRFKTTLVGLNEAPEEGNIVAIGFYGTEFSVSFGSEGGWDSFGVERLITKSEHNILYELDGKPALDIYKLYLGEYANELPGSGLLFPLSIRQQEDGYSVVRTILGISEKNKSLIFAGNMPEGSYAQLMKANLERLIDGASKAAITTTKHDADKQSLAILISCMGRKLVLDQRTEEEVEAIQGIYGVNTTLTGFYSYGEISPSNFSKCELHNQTMTITKISEQ